MTRSKQALTQQFRLTHLSFSKFYASKLTSLNISLPQYTLLNILKMSGPIKMTVASEALVVTKAAVTHLVDTLESKKMVKRVPSDQDRRVTLIHIAPAGEKLVEKVHAVSTDFLNKTMHNMTVSELEASRKFFELLSHYIEKSIKE